MHLTTRRLTTALLAATLLLCSSSLMAALRSRSSSMHARAHHAARLSRASYARGHRSHARSHARRHGRSYVVRSSRAHLRGQQAIDPARTLEIQQALIREGYLDGVPTGHWDQATREALLRLQSDNHWQTKIVPDSRALIKLGLGPSEQNLLNPETAAIARALPGPATSAPSDPTQAGAN
jgi:Putative peptidoglycan binding domain